MANVNLQGSIVILNLYDIAEEINLSDLPQLIGGTRLSDRKPPRRKTTQ